MKRPIVQSGDGGQIEREIDALGTGVGVAAVTAGTKPALITQGDEVGGVEGFDVRTGRGGPVADYSRGAAVAAGLVAEFPGEDGGASFVAVHDERDVGSIGGLSGRCSVEGSRVAGEDGTVGVDSTQVVPVVEHGEDKGYAVFLGGGYYGVETGDT